MIKKFIAVALVGAYFTTAFTPLANAKIIAQSYEEELSQELTKEEEDKAQKLAEELEFIFEEGSVKDEYGNLIGFKEDILIERFGDTDEIKELMEISEVLTPAQESNTGIQLMNRHDDANKCVNKKVAKEFKDLVSGSLLNEAVGAIISGSYLLGAKKLIKLGAKGSALSIAGSLIIIAAKCANNPYK